MAGIRTLADANRYLTERFIADYNRTFGGPLADPTSAFVPSAPTICQEEERVVGRDKTVTLDQGVLQLDKQRGRRSCGGRACSCAVISVRSIPSGRGRAVSAASPPRGNHCRARRNALSLKADRSLVKLERSDHLLTTLLLTAAVLTTRWRGRMVPA